MPLLGTAFARRTLGLMLAGVAVLVIIVITSIWLVTQVDNQSAEVIRAREIRTLSSSVLASVLEAESGQRGFLITEDRRYLDAYQAARVQVTEDLIQLRTRLSASPESMALIQRLEKATEAKIAELTQTIELAGSGRREEALAIVRSDRGKAIMDETRLLLRDLMAQAEAGVGTRIAALTAAADTLLWTTVAGGLLILAFGGGAFWTVTRYTRELVASQREVATLNVGLEARVAERTSDLTRANEEIQRFAYIVSHDLRSPLVNIMGFTSELEVSAETLQKFVALEAPDPELAKAAKIAVNDDLPEAVGFIRTSTKKMDALINAILKLSREGRRELRPGAVDLALLFKATAASAQHRLDEAGARVELPPHFPRIVSDRLALEQVFDNLIGNAVKYLAKGRPGVIRILAEEKHGRVRISVADNGRGIADHDHERIFELFRRSGAQDQAGEGIGLAHVRALVRRLGGTISVQSRLGEGSTFRVDLPKSLSTSKESYQLA